MLTEARPAMGGRDHDLRDIDGVILKPCSHISCKQQGFTEQCAKKYSQEKTQTMYVCLPAKVSSRTRSPRALIRIREFSFTSTRADARPSMSRNLDASAAGIATTSFWEW